MTKSCLTFGFVLLVASLGLPARAQKQGVRDACTAQSPRHALQDLGVRSLSAPLLGLQGHRLGRGAYQGITQGPSGAKPRRVRDGRDLASEKFAICEKAMETLRPHGRSAAAALRAALKQEQQLEAKRRMETLLFEWSQPAPLTSEILRHIRATAVLERLVTSEGDRLLQQIAAGAPDVLVTKEAQMALIRRGKQ